MSNFGEVASDTTLIRTIYINATTWGKGASAPNEVAIGVSPAIQALNFNNLSQSIVTSVMMPVNWDRTVNVTMDILCSLENVELDGDGIDLGVDYVVTGTGSANGFLKTSTSLIETLTVSTANGLAIGDLYLVTFTLASGDADNPFAGQDAIGLEFFLAGITAGIQEINVANGRINYRALY